MAGENKQSFYIGNSKNVLIQDCVTYGYAAALMFVGGGTNQNVELYRVHNTVHSGYELDEATYQKYLALEEEYDVDLEIYVDEQNRYRGSTPRVGSVDATHVNSAASGMNITSCLFESMCDDGSNQRGSSSRLHNIVDNKDGTTTLTYKGTISETYYWYNQQYGRTTNTGTQTVNFKKGDKIFVYTDGVPEATNANEELFGTDRMIEALNVNAGASPEEILGNVRTSVDRFVGNAEQFDDLTMLCLEYRGTSE
jgi:hypothetical protein